VTRPGTVLFAALLAASAALAAVVVHARSPDLVLEVTRFPTAISPNGDGSHDVARIRFFVRKTDPNATVEIVGPNLTVARTLAERPLIANEPVTLSWNGRTDSGALADPRDRYRLRVILPGEDRDMVYPRRIAVRGVGPK